MAASVLKLGQLCSAATATGDMVAVATPSHSVVLLRRDDTGWIALEKGEHLSESHEGTITSLAFTAASVGGTGATPLRLVSCSHDRNSYVWTQQQQQQQPAEGDGRQRDANSSKGGGSGSGGRGSGAPGGQRQHGWRAELVITRLSKAGLCCAWAPGGLKFAIGSSDRLVDVVCLDAERELWAPKLIKKRHGGAVMALAWHPCGAALATAASDGRLRVLNAAVPEVDTPPSPAALAGSRFGDCLLELELPGSGWGVAAAFSPSGTCLAVASQAAEGSHLTLLSGIDLDNRASLDAAGIAAAAAAAEAGEAARLQRVRLPGLPLKCLAFLSETLLVGGGFDCQPQLFSRRADGRWQFATSLQGVKLQKQAEPVKQASSSLSARIKLFEQQAAVAAAVPGGGSGKAAAAAAKPAAGGSGSSQGSGGPGGPHQACITSISPLPSTAAAGGSGGVRFVTASLDGCIAEWCVDPDSL